MIFLAAKAQQDEIAEFNRPGAADIIPKIIDVMAPDGVDADDWE